MAMPWKNPTEEFILRADVQALVKQVDFQYPNGEEGKRIYHYSGGTR